MTDKSATPADPTHLLDLTPRSTRFDISLGRTLHVFAIGEPTAGLLALGAAVLSLVGRQMLNLSGWYV